MAMQIWQKKVTNYVKYITGSSTIYIPLEVVRTVIASLFIINFSFSLIIYFIQFLFYLFK